MSVVDSPRRRTWPWAAVGALSVLALVGVIPWFISILVEYSRRPTAERAGLATDVNIYVSLSGLLVALSSLLVAILQLRQASRPSPTAPSLPPGAHIRQDVTAAVPGAIAQGVVVGSIHNRFENAGDVGKPSTEEGAEKTT